MTNEQAAAGPGRAANGGVAVEARELTRRFGSHTALDAISLRVESGEAFGLLGANGAGKTTFMRLVTGYLLPSSGTVAVGGFAPATHAAEVHARLGFVAETSRLYPDLRVAGFLRFAGGARGLTKGALAAAVESAIERFHLGGVASRLIGHLSKGFQQRVSLAQAFLHDPALVIVDEPTSGLDPIQQEEVRGILAGLRGTRTLILCTHDLTEARDLTRRVAVLHRGKLAAMGPTPEVLGGEDPLSLFRGREASA